MGFPAKAKFHGHFSLNVLRRYDHDNHYHQLGEKKQFLLHSYTKSNVIRSWDGLAMLLSMHSGCP
jgi:hypothetical protein